MATVDHETTENVETRKTKVARPARASTLSKRRRFNVDEYYKMAEAGILKPDERVELIEGVVVTMSPVGRKHFGGVFYLCHYLTLAFQKRAGVVAQSPLQLGERSEPEPDIAVYKWNEDFFRTIKPSPTDVYFLIEVMDSSAKHDRGRKLRLYARHNIPELWLVDLQNEWIEIHRRPSGETFREKRTVTRGETLSPEAFPDIVLEVNAILGDKNPGDATEGNR